MDRVKTFEATGTAPNGRLYAGDLNAIQDAAAGIDDLTQHINLGSISIGESGLQLLRYGASEARLSGALRTDKLIRALGGIMPPQLTTTQRDALPSGERPFTLIIYNTTTSQYEFNAGTDGTPNWQPLSSSGLEDGSVTNDKLAANAVTTDKIQDGTITAGDISGTLKPSVSAAAGTEALRALGTTGSTAAAGNDPRLSDQRVPTDGSVTNAKVASDAAIAYSKLALTNSIVNGDIASAAGIVYSKLNLTGSITHNDVASANKDGTAGTPSLRTLGTGATQACAGNDSRLSDQRVPTDGSVTDAKLSGSSTVIRGLGVNQKISGGVTQVTVDGTGAGTINYGHTFTVVYSVVATLSNSADRRFVTVTGAGTSNFTLLIQSVTGAAANETHNVSWIVFGV